MNSKNLQKISPCHPILSNVIIAAILLLWWNARVVVSNKRICSIFTGFLPKCVTFIWNINKNCLIWGDIVKYLSISYIVNIIWLPVLKHCSWFKATLLRMIVNKTTIYKIPLKSVLLLHIRRYSSLFGSDIVILFTGFFSYNQYF